MSSVRAAFEQVYYPSLPRAACTPDRLAAVATLFGLSPPDPETARVLEVGCSDGGCILPMALVTPQSRFLGIDFAATAIERGRQQIADLKLKNIELRAVDLTQFPADAGFFDYIIVHGVFSWVPPAVRPAILSLIRRHLAPTGVAYVDYNAQPGAQRRYAFRGAMRYHVQRFADPQQRIDQARSLIKLIVDANPHNPPYRKLAEAELQSLLQKSDATVFHDSLADYNEPFYFHEFAGLAAEHGLQYLGEADVWEMHDDHLPAPIREHLATLRNLIDKEQYLDILKSRVFRQTLLCHADLGLNRLLDGATLRSLYFSLKAGPVRSERGRLSFEVGSLEVEVRHPTARAIVDALLKVWPGRLSAQELIETIGQSVGATAAQAEPQLRALLLHAVLSGVIRIHSRPTPFTTTVSDRPVASPLARYQAERGRGISTLDQSPIELPEQWLLQMLPLLDGTRGIPEIATALKMEESDVRQQLQTLAGLALLMRPA